MATGLARWGNPACIDVLDEMLDPESQRGVANEPSDRDRDYKRAVIVTNGLRATRMLAEANATADLSVLSNRVKLLADSSPQREIRVEAASTLDLLERR